MVQGWGGDKQPPRTPKMSGAESNGCQQHRLFFSQQVRLSLSEAAALTASTVELGKNGMEREKEGNSTMLGCLLRKNYVTIPKNNKEDNKVTGVSYLKCMITTNLTKRKSPRISLKGRKRIYLLDM